jgi:hypothetical protein
MWKKVFITVLLAVAVQAAAADTPAVKEKAQRIEAGKQVEVRQAAEPGRLRGQLERVTDDAVVLRVVDGNEELRKTVPFEKIKSIRELPAAGEKTNVGHRLWRGVLALAYAFTHVIDP